MTATRPTIKLTVTFRSLEEMADFTQAIKQTREWLRCESSSEALIVLVGTATATLANDGRLRGSLIDTLDRARREGP